MTLKTKSLALLFLLFTMLCISQNLKNNHGKYVYNNTPSFNGVSNNLPREIKLDQVRWKTQDFISNTISKDFINSNFKAGDSIQFDLGFLITKRGKVKHATVKTPIDDFNKEIIKILKELPKFTPATYSDNHNSFDFEFGFRPEFYLDQNKKLIPIYRKFLDKYDFNIDSKITDSIRVNHYPELKEREYASLYFSTNSKKELIRFTAFTTNESYSAIIKKHFKNLKETNINLSKSLRPNHNYWIPLNINENYIEKEQVITTEFHNETVPIYPGCEKEVGIKKQKACMAQKIKKHVAKEFNTDLASDLNLTGIVRTIVAFNISKDGNIVKVKARSTHPYLEKEAVRVIKLLPKMTPGTQDGRKVSVPYSLPINFNIKESGKSIRDRNLNMKQF